MPNRFSTELVSIVWKAGTLTDSNECSGRKGIVAVGAGECVCEWSGEECVGAVEVVVVAMVAVGFRLQQRVTQSTKRSAQLNWGDRTRSAGRLIRSGGAAVNPAMATRALRIARA